ncbi:leucine-rich repeat protein [Jutongia sp.]|uniref:leucine-rich repeat protein n=1 Tax=Jutongia sp. TaxID=2944204 RepID=UPI003080584C
MHKKFYFNNNQSQIKRIRKNLKQQWTKAVCIGTLSATVLTGVPVFPVTHAYAQEVSVQAEKNVTYNLQDTELLTEKTIADYGGKKYKVTIIEINITEDGTYTITGSNEINGTYMDVHITVADGVKANVILDNVNIQNDDLYDLDIKGCASDDERDQLFPFMEIMGTANLYLKGENTITIPVLDKGNGKVNTSVIFKLYGQLTVREDAGTPGSSLEINNAGYLLHGGGSDEYSSVGGSFTMESGTLTAWGASINYLEQWHMLGGTVNCYRSELVNYGDYQFLGGDINTGMGYQGTLKVGAARLLGSVSSRVSLEDRNGYPLQKLTVSNLPASQKVTAVNGYPSSTLETSETGTLEAYLRKGSNVIEIDGKSYLYKWYEETSKLERQSDAELCTVQFVLDGSESPYCTVKVEKNTAFGKLFNDNQYTYTYQTKDGTEFNEKTEITSDMTVTMKSYVREYNVTIDGVTEKMSTLPAGKMYLNPPESYDGSSKYYYDYGSCYYGGSRVTRDMTLESLDVVADHGTDYVKISDKEELIRFFKMAAVDDHINARLEADIDMNGERLTIYIGDYAGIFDGNGYSIKKMKGEQNATGAICRTLKGTIRNLCIEDIWLPGSEDEIEKYYGRGSAGVICGINRGLIENCKVAGSKITLNCVSTSGIYESGYDPMGTVAGVNLGEIRNCLAVKNEFDTSIFKKFSTKPDESKILFPIAGNYGTITNCYYDATENVETEDTELRAGIGRTAEIFKSGEICYLLNDKISDGTQAWYQKLSEETGDPYPTLVKEEGNTVYDGYVNCTKAYTNEKDSKETHTFTYTAKEDTLTATCKWAEDHQASAVLKVASAVYDKKEHSADVDYEDAWTALGIEPADIQYLRDGKPTTDITSVGTITAVLAQGDVKAEKEYTIAKAAQPDNVPEASASVPFTQKKVTQDMLKLENGWEISEDSIGMDIPEKESVTIDVVYTGEDAQSYENIMAKVQVQRAACGHDLVKVDAVAATESKEGNKEYYLCKDCGKLFGDAQGTKEITKESTVLPKVEKPQPTVKPTVVPATSVPGTSIPASGAPATTPGTTAPASGAPSETPGTTTPASGAPTTTPGTTTPATGAPTTTPGTTAPASGAPSATPGTTTPASGAPATTPGTTTPATGAPTTTPTPDIPAPAPGTSTPAPGAPTPVPDMPTPAPGAPTPIPTAAPQETAQSSAKQSSVPKTEKKDSKLTDETGATYKVTGTTDKKPTVTYISTKKTGKASITIPSSIEVNGVKYQVTSIADNAFRKNKKLKKITIGKEIVSIGKRAFEGCKNLKEIVIETEKLKAKTIGKKAFAKTSSEAVVNVPKKKAKEYKKLLRKRGLSKNAVFKTK